MSGRSRVCVCPAGLGPARAPSTPVSVPVPVPHGREQALARWAPSAVRSRGTTETRTKRGTGSPATGPGLVSPRRSRGSPRRMCFGNTATQWRGYSGSPSSTSTPVPRPGSSVFVLTNPSQLLLLRPLSVLFCVSCSAPADRALIDPQSHSRLAVSPQTHPR